ncbi:ABC transporter ATP-binding protein [soil metagenome]
MTTPDTQAKAAKPLTNRQVLGFVARQWLRRPVALCSQLSLVGAATLCDLAAPWAAGGLVDAVTHAGHGPADAWRAWATLTALYAGYFGLRTGAFRVMNGFAASNMKDVADRGFRLVQSFSADWHSSAFAGATVRKVSRAMAGYDDITDAFFLMLGPTLIVLVGLTVSMALRWPLAGLFTGVVVAAYMTSQTLLTTLYARPANLRSTALDSEIGASLADAIGNNAAVKSFGAEAREEARLNGVTKAWRDAQRKTWNRFNEVSILQSVLLLALQAGLTGFLVHAWSQGRATPGDVAFAISAFALMSGYLRNFGELTRQFQRGIDNVMDVAVYDRTPPQVADRAGAGELKPTRGSITFDHVRFGYANQGAELYDDFSLAIAPGERVALVGPTGAGKSTFVKLIQRLYDLDGGRILIDGTDIAAVTQASLRRAVAVVPQDPALFHRSIAENIAYGRPDATPEEVRLAAKRARAHDFIERLPNGYDTLVGERGVKLSGGERQRVAIARALLADAPILVLDEATSSLDVETEKQVQAGAEALMEGRTTVVIAHRLSTIRGADRILVFQGGKVVEEGRHGELIAKGGAYARLSALTDAG